MRIIWSFLILNILAGCSGNTELTKENALPLVKAYWDKNNYWSDCKDLFFFRDNKSAQEAAATGFRFEARNSNWHRYVAAWIEENKHAWVWDQLPGFDHMLRDTRSFDKSTQVCQKQQLIVQEVGKLPREGWRKIHVALFTPLPTELRPLEGKLVTATFWTLAAARNEGEWVLDNQRARGYQ